MPSGPVLTFSDSYSRILAEIARKSPEEVELAKSALSFLLCATRPTSTREITHALAIESDSTCFEEERLPFRSIDEICGPIVEIHKQYITLVHFSAKEWVLERLLNTYCALTRRFRYIQRQESGPFLDRWVAEFSLARRCLTYFHYTCFRPELQDAEIQDHIGSGQYVWFEYAETNWLLHCRNAMRAPDNLPSILSQSLTTFFTRWTRDPPRLPMHNRVADHFGFKDLRDYLAPKDYHTLLTTAFYQAQGRSSGYMEGMSDSFPGELLR